MQSLRRRTQCIALGCLVLFAALTGGSMAARRRSSDPASLRKRLDSVATQLSSKRRQLRITKQRQQQVTRRLEEIEANLDASEQRLHGIKVNVSATRVNLRRAISRLRRANQEVEDRRDIVSERLVALNEEGEVKPIEVVFEATSFSDLANRAYLANEVVASDAAALDSLAQAQDRADDHRQQVAEQERQYTSLQHQEEGVRQVTLTKRAETQEEKNQVLSERRNLERALEELEADSRAITAMLRAMQHRGGRGGGAIVTPWRGSFIRPVNGARITSEFGYRMHPILHTRKMHTGLDLAAATGTPIHAAAGGVVLYSGRFRGYGNTVMIDHGGGIVTLYGHCSSLACSVGQKVDQGQTIAYVGSTGLSTGPHCHFEVRRNGAPVNPFSKM